MVISWRKRKGLETIVDVPLGELGCDCFSECAEDSCVMPFHDIPVWPIIALGSDSRMGRRLRPLAFAKEGHEGDSMHEVMRTQKGMESISSPRLRTMQSVGCG